MFHDAPVEAAVAVHRHRHRPTTAASEALKRITREYQLHRVATFLLTGEESDSIHDCSSVTVSEPSNREEAYAQPGSADVKPTGGSCCCQSVPAVAASYTRVALQFPDDLLGDSVAVVAALQDILKADPRYAAALDAKRSAVAVGQNTNGNGRAAGSAAGAAVSARPPAMDNPHCPVNEVRLFVLADNTFGSCCPDEITAQHYMTDCIVHFGNACMSRSTRLPVLYVQPPFRFEALSVSSDSSEETRRASSSAEPSSAPQLQRAEVARQRAEASLVLELVRRVSATLQRRWVAWLRDQSMGPDGCPAVKPCLTIAATYPTKTVMQAAERRWRDLEAAPAPGSIAVDWPRFEERHGGLFTKPPTCREEKNSSEGDVDTADAGVSADSDWVVNGVRFPRVASSLAAGSQAGEQTVQYLLFVGAAGSSALVHVLAAEQYNEFHYSDVCSEFIAWDSGEEETSLPVVTVVDDTFGLEEVAAGCAPLLQTALTVSPTQPATDALASVDSAVAQWVSAVLPDGVSALVTGDYVVAHQTLQRRVRQRAFNIESVRASSAIGILVASLAIEGYYEVTQQLHQLIRAYGKRSYIIYVGHLNEFKLANFVDTVDCFVTVACPYSRQSHFPEKRDNFMKPLVSPAELLVALTTSDDTDATEQYGMTAVYTTAFETVLRVLREAVAVRKSELEARARGDAASDARRKEEEERWASSGVLVRSGAGAGGGALTVQGSSQGALARLYEREYVGLDPRIGQTPVQTEVLEGKHGIARGYAKEREEQGTEPPVSNYK